MQHAEGLFQIHAKFMGVRLEHVEVDIQDLLQLQYDGVAVMNMFGKAKINVNQQLSNTASARRQEKTATKQS